MEEYNPMVSIVIPAYNASNYLSQAIDSALGQTYKNIEIIVINDGSDDNDATKKIAMSYGNKIKYFEKKNGGSSSALNFGIKNMKGEWFSWLSHDDIYYPNKIENQIRFLQSLEINSKDIEKQVIFSAIELIDENNKILRHSSLRKEIKKFKCVEQKKDNGYFIAEPTKYSFYGCSCLINKRIFTKIGFFDEKLIMVNDIDMWFRIYKNNYHVHYLPKVLVQQRIHSKQISKSIGFSYHNSEQDMFWNRTLQWLIDNRNENYQFFYSFGKNAFYKTRNKEGSKAFLHANSLKPSKKIILIFTKYGTILIGFMRSIVKNIFLKFKL